MATNNLVGADTGVAALGTSKESDNGRAITSEVVALAASEVPFFGFFNFDETVILQLLLAVVDSVEVGGGGVETIDDLLGVDLAGG